MDEYIVTFYNEECHNITFKLESLNDEVVNGDIVIVRYKRLFDDDEEKYGSSSFVVGEKHTLTNLHSFCEYELYFYNYDDELLYSTISPYLIVKDFIISDDFEEFKFKCNINYGTIDVSSFSTYKATQFYQYPYIVDNGEDNYKTGSITLTILNEDFIETGKINIQAIKERADNFRRFLKKKNYKLIRDWNKKEMCVYINSNISYSISSNTSVITFSFNYVEIQADEYILGW